MRTYVAVDGGMSDNIRPTAYGAKYTAALANRVHDSGVSDVAIAGKYCETGDILIQKVALPLPRVGDLVAVPVSGAYQLAMASNYNLAPRPAVVLPRRRHRPVRDRMRHQNRPALPAVFRGDARLEAKVTVAAQGTFSATE